MNTHTDLGHFYKFFFSTIKKIATIKKKFLANIKNFLRNEKKEANKLK